MMQLQTGIRAISVKEPYVSMIAKGYKGIETRTWYTSYRGPLLICGSQNPKGEYAGRAACIVDLYKITRMTKEDEKAACCELYPRALSWHIKLLHVLTEDIKIKGKLQIFTIVNKDISRIMESVINKTSKI